MALSRGGADNDENVQVAQVESSAFEQRHRRGLSAAALRHLVDGVAPGGRALRYRPLRGGISASVYLVHVEASDGAHQAVVLRRYDAAWHRADPEGCTREFKVLDELSRWSFPAPRPLLLDQEFGRKLCSRRARQRIPTARSAKRVLILV
jgi:hypothetical protein